MQETVQAALQNLGHTVVTADDGQAGLRQYTTGPFDLVITDCIMPRLDGVGTIMALKQRNPGVRIIAISGGGRGRASDYLRVAHNLGARHTLQKPFSFDELALTVRVALDDPT